MRSFRLLAALALLPFPALAEDVKLYKEKPDAARRVIECFVDATKAFLDKPDLAEKYVRENLFKGQLTHEDYKDAMSNAQFTYDITVEHVQVTTET